MAQFFPRVNCWADIQELLKSKSLLSYLSRGNIKILKTFDLITWLKFVQVLTTGKTSFISAELTDS